MMMFSVVLLLLARTTAARRKVQKSRSYRRLSNSLSSRSPLRKLGLETVPSSLNCTWKYYSQSLDHFAVGSAGTYDQRVCVYDGFVRGSKPSHVLFYTGNESPVEEYANNTGLMWEVGADLGSLLVFAEHRYEGKSVPVTQNVRNCLSYCTTEQALGDYAALVSTLRDEYESPDLPFAAIGGSYGGMLSSWFRMKYPSAVVGAIAGSAPIWGFPTIDGSLDSSSVAVARNFGTSGGLPNDNCRLNLLGAWPLMAALGKTQEGREYLAETMGLCDASATGYEIAEAVQGVFFDLAEGNYPFASTYITSAVGPGYFPLPPWPIRVACEPLVSELFVHFTGNISEVIFEVATSDDLATVAVNWDQVTNLEPIDLFRKDDAPLSQLLKGVANVWATWCNVTTNLQCLSASAGAYCATGGAPPFVEQEEEALYPLSRLTSNDDSDVCTAASYSGGSWEPVCCNDDLNLVNTIAQGTGRDELFWPPNLERNYSLASVLGVPYGESTRGCRSPIGLAGYPATSDPWARNMITQYGDKQSAQAASNIVFSNGRLDPWSASGVYADAKSTLPGFEGPYVQNVSLASTTAYILDLGTFFLQM